MTPPILRLAQKRSKGCHQRPRPAACGGPIWPPEGTRLLILAPIPGPYSAPNITPDPATGLGRWSEADLVRALGRAITPAREPIRRPMAEYVASGSSRLTAADLTAMAT